MKLSTKYILFTIFLHVVILVLAYFLFSENSLENNLYFIGAEILVLISLYYSYKLYSSLVNPIQMINTGVDAMADKDFSVKFQETGQKDIDSLVSVYNGMIDQLREERTEKIQKHFFLEKLINNSPSGIVVLDLEGKVSSCNPRALQFLKVEDEDQLQDASALEKTPLLRAIMELEPGQTQIISVHGLETFKCQKAQFIDRGFTNFFIILEELTSEKLEIEKLAYGKVIRMMAHEVNNSIGPINSILESLEHYQKYIPEEDRDSYGEILKIAHQRNEKLNDFMRNFASVVRLPQPMLEKSDLRKVLESVANLMAFQTGEKQIAFELDLPPQEVWLEMDVQQMEQVLINLLKNAIEAIEQAGTIRIHLSDSPPILRIEDTGTGISEEMAQQVFSPFYSSKKNGQGIGLTLSREILMNHGYEFSLRPGIDKGAVFEVKFKN